MKFEVIEGGRDKELSPWDRVLLAAAQLVAAGRRSRLEHGEAPGPRHFTLLGREFDADAVVMVPAKHGMSQKILAQVMWDSKPKLGPVLVKKKETE